MKKKRARLTLISLALLLLLNIGLGVLLMQDRIFNKNSATFSELETTDTAVMSFQELSDFFKKLSQEKGAPYAYRVLKIAPVAPNIDMHLMGHIVGDELYKQQGIKGMQVCTQDFRNACSHTIVVGAFFDKGEAAFPEITDVCRKAPGGKGAYTMCFHGLGHGVLAYLNFDLKKAITMCEKTGSKTNQNREAVECIGGTVMEILEGGFHDRATWAEQRVKYVSNEHPLAPCDSDFMPDEARSICYTYLTPHLLEVAGANLGSPTVVDYEKAFPFCDKVPVSQPQNRQACYGGFGKEFVVLAQDRDVRAVEDMSEDRLANVYAWCKLAHNEQGTKACMESAIGSLYWGGENNPKAAIRFCSIIDDSALQQDCAENLIMQVSFYMDDKGYRQNFCSQLPESYQAICKSRLL
jgi:hypothetical protein